MAMDLKEAISIIRSGEWFSIRFITANILKGTGGKIMEFAKCRIARKKGLNESGMAIASASGITKEARHHFNFTINLELQNKLIRKVHPILITHLNNEKVL